MQLPLVGGACQPGDISSAEIEHPLRRGDGLFVIPQFRVGIRQVAIGDDVVGHFLIELHRGSEGLGEFVVTQLDPGAGLEALIVIGREHEGALESLFGFRVVLNIGRLPSAAGVGHRERVVIRRVIRMLGNVGLSLFDRYLGRSSGKRSGGEQQNCQCLHGVAP